MCCLFVVGASLFLSVPRSAQATCPGNWGDSLATYRSVVANSNGTDVGCSNGSSSYGYKYQCVEFVKRFYGEAMHFSSTPWSGDGVDYYGSAATKGLRQFADGGSVKPKENDILCFSGNTFGHVGIITEVGSNYVKMIDQNRTTSGGSNNPKQLTLSGPSGGWSISSFSGSYPVQGWLRGYTSDYKDQTPSGTATLTPGQALYFKVRYTNTSHANAPHWKNDGGSQSVELRSCTSTGVETSSFLYPVSGQTTWLDPTDRKRIVHMTESDVGGNTGVATFEFWAKVPESATLGTHNVYFRPYHQSGQWIEEWDGMYFSINVVAPIPDPAYGLILRNPSTAEWWTRVSNGLAFAYPPGANTPADLWISGWALDDGSYTFTPYVGDLNGDTYDDLVVERSDCKWYVAWNNQDGSFTSQGSPILNPWATSPSPGKYFFWFTNVTGDAKDELLTYDASNGNWYVCTFNTSTNTFDNCSTWLTWGGGVGTFQPLAGDWNGDGKSDICLRNPSTGNHYVRLSSGTGFYQGTNDNWIGWGAGSEFIPIVGDWNGDGKDDLMLWKTSTGEWFVRTSDGTAFVYPSGSNSPADRWMVWGDPSYTLFTGDFNDDGKVDVGLRNPSTGDHWVRTSTGLAFTQPSPDNWLAGWGGSSYQLLTGRFGNGELGGGFSLQPAPPEDDQPPPAVPLSFRIWVAPNPTTSNATVNFALPTSDRASISIYDVSGREVAQFPEEPYGVGQHTLTWSRTSPRGGRVADGIYFLTFRSTLHTISKKIIVLN